MKKIATKVALGLGALMLGISSVAAEKGTAEEAAAMVKKGIEFIKLHGKEKAFAEFSNPSGQFVKGDLYVMCYDMEGNNKCHGGNSKLIGKNLLEIKDASGVFIVKSFIDMAKSKGNGWIDYKWPNTVTKAVESKSTYIEKVDDNLLIGVGIYK